MPEYGLVFENELNQLIYVGSYVGPNHYKIKFEMLKYMKNYFKSRGIAISVQKKFGIYEMKKQIIHWYVGQTVKISPQRILNAKITSIHKVYKISDDDCGEILNKIKDTKVPYLSVTKYKENLEDEMSHDSESAFGTIEMV